MRQSERKRLPYKIMHFGSVVCAFSDLITRLSIVQLNVSCTRWPHALARRHYVRCPIPDAWLALHQPHSCLRIPRTLIVHAELFLPYIPKFLVPVSSDGQKRIVLNWSCCDGRFWSSITGNKSLLPRCQWMCFWKPWNKISCWYCISPPE